MTSADPPKLLVLLGAGASHGYGPSTAWLTRRLLAARSGPRGAPLLRLVHQGLRAFLSHRTLQGLRETVEPNFEEIIQAVDEIAGHAPSPATIFDPGRAESLLSPFVTLKPSLKRLRPQQERYRRYASRAREFVVRQPIRYCVGAPDP